MNQNQQHGARTGQHTGPRQQAALPGCVEACEEIERAKPVMRITCDLDTGAREHCDAAVIQELAGVFFAHPERIQVERFTNVSPWQDAARAALARAAAEDAVMHCDICGAAAGTCDCDERQTAAERAAEWDGDRRGDEDRDQ